MPTLHLLAILTILTAAWCPQASALDFQPAADFYDGFSWSGTLLDGEGKPVETVLFCEKAAFSCNLAARNGVLALPWSGSGSGMARGDEGLAWVKGQATAEKDKRTVRILFRCETVTRATAGTKSHRLVELAVEVQSGDKQPVVYKMPKAEHVDTQAVPDDVVPGTGESNE